MMVKGIKTLNDNSEIEINFDGSQNVFLCKWDETIKLHGCNYQQKDNS